MRQRITYLQEPQDAIDPGTLKVTKNSISTKSIAMSNAEEGFFKIAGLHIP
jgi:hypothetical protein